MVGGDDSVFIEQGSATHDLMVNCFHLLYKSGVCVCVWCVHVYVRVCVCVCVCVKQMPTVNVSHSW